MNKRLTTSYNFLTAQKQVRDYFTNLYGKPVTMVVIGSRIFDLSNLSPQDVQDIENLVNNG